MRRISRSPERRLAAFSFVEIRRGNLVDVSIPPFGRVRCFHPDDGSLQLVPDGGH